MQLKMLINFVWNAIQIVKSFFLFILGVISNASCTVGNDSSKCLVCSDLSKYL